MTSVEFLEESLLFHMSLGSKELYHSNVWAWLIENDSNFAKAFFPYFESAEWVVNDVRREWHNRDLIITLRRATAKEPSCYLVIENKIKSMHDREQLMRYSEDLDGLKLISGTFTGIRNTLGEDKIEFPKKNNPSETVQWEFVCYKDIADCIRTVAQKSRNSVVIKHMAQILEYSEIIDAIEEVISDNLKQYENMLQFDCEQAGDLQKIRFLSVFHNLKGADFLGYVNRRRSELEQLCPEGFQLDIHQSFNNGNVTLDFRITDENDDSKDKEFLSIGIQIQGSQYRYVAVRKCNHSVQEIFDEFAGVWFDGNFVKGKKIHGRQTVQSQLFNTYKKDNYTFVYQYNNLIGHGVLSYENIFRDIKSDLAIIKQLLSGVEQEMPIIVQERSNEIETHYAESTIATGAYGTVKIIIKNREIYYDWNNNIISSPKGKVMTDRKNGFQAYDSDGNFIGVVYNLADDEGKTKYPSFAEIMFAKKFNDKFGRWHRIKIDGENLPYEKLAAILEKKGKMELYISPRPRMAKNG